MRLVVQTITSASRNLSLKLHSTSINRSLLKRHFAMPATVQQKEFKLKAANFPQKNGDKVEAEIEGLIGSKGEPAKVLLLKANGEMRALGPRCTRMSIPN
jgi:hypothetical protein